MSDLGQLIYTRLTGDAAVAAIVGARVYPVFVPSNATLPCCTYERISAQFSYPIGTNPPSGVTARYQVNCYADGRVSDAYSKAASLGAAVKRAMESLPGTDTLADNDWDDYEPESQRVIRRIDFLITGDEMP